MLKPKMTKNLEEKIRKVQEDKRPKTLKPLYKMKIFNNVGSKVVEGLKKKEEILKNRMNGKSQKEEVDDENIDRLINKVQNEIEEMK